MQAGPRPQRATIFWSLVLLAVAFSGCSASPVSRQATPTPTFSILTPIPTDPSSVGVHPPPFSGALAAPPTDCPTAPPLQKMTRDNFGGGFRGTTTFYGVSPVWGWPATAGATIHFHQFIGTPAGRI